METTKYLTRSELAAYNQRNELVPIGTNVITVQLGECKIKQNNWGKTYPYLCEGNNGQISSYMLDFKQYDSHIHISLLDPTPTTVDCGFTKEELERIQQLTDGSINHWRESDKDIWNKTNHLLTAPQHFPCEMEVSVDGDFSANMSNISSFKHARPIAAKEKELKDLVKGIDYVWALSFCVMLNGEQKGKEALKPFKKYCVIDVRENSIVINDEFDELHYFDNKDLGVHISLTPPTKSQIEAAKAAAIAEVEKRFKEIEEVGNE